MRIKDTLIRRLIYVTILLATSNLLFSQNSYLTNPGDSLEMLEFNARLSNLLNMWYKGNNLPDTSLEKLNRYNFKPDNIPVYSDEVYTKRLNQLNSPIPLTYNQHVKRYIELYTVRKRDQVERMLGLGVYYFPIFEEELDKQGMPLELKYVPVIESALNTHAVSRSGATGLWQFIYNTARLYKFRITSYIDERRDPYKATEIGVKYFKDLYSVYKDWLLVIASYNCGPGNVNKAIRRSGYKTEFWDVYPYLPRETRGYLPGYIAATYAMTYHKEHNIVPKHVTFPVVTDTIMLTQDIHLRQIAEVLSVPYAELRTLNPQYRASLIPGSSKPMPLTLPLNNVGDFISLEDSIASHRADHYLKPQTKTASPTRSTYTPPDIKGKTKLIYIVKEGDNLGYIASWYNVGLSNLRYWNNIYRNTIRIGQKISVFVDPSKKDYYTAVNKLSFEEKQKRIGKSVPVNTSTTSTAANFGGKFVYHTVRSGDTVWDIAKEYDGVSASEILSINGMSGSGKIAVGQRLKIKRKS